MKRRRVTVIGFIRPSSHPRVWAASRQDLQPLSIGHVADGHLADRFEKFFHRWISKYSRVGVLVVRLPVDGILLVIVHVLLLLPRCPPEA